jgi:uncharacterized protein (TIGR03000 family)
MLAVTLLAATPAAWAGPPPPGGWPWERRPKIHGYDDKPPAAAPPENVTRRPEKYTITITVLPQKVEGANTASVMAHLPEGAMLWFDGKPTRQRGMLREFESPPLKPGRKYTYTIRMVWFEDGRWVHDTKDVPVSAGDVSCVFLSKPSALAAALGKLSPEHRKLAELQGRCAVQPENQLGAMGVPIKLMVNEEPVFLCCEGCAEKARKLPPEKLLAKAKELKSKNVSTPPK